MNATLRQLRSHRQTALVAGAEMGRGKTWQGVHVVWKKKHQQRLDWAQAACRGKKKSERGCREKIAGVQTKFKETEKEKKKNSL